MATEIGANLVGDYEHRRAGRGADGEFACFECVDTTRFRKDCMVYQEIQKNCKCPPHGAKKGGEKGANGKRSGK